MDDLISREETLKAMDTWDKFGNDAYGRLFPLRSQDELHLYVPYVHYADMVNAVKGMPSAQTKGRWSWVQYDSISELGDWYCSECRFMPAAFNLAKKHLNYCPSCGAKMI